jgi:acyl-CoA-binding protein
LSEHSPTPSTEEIAALAYALYERGAPGDADDHWRAAERELRSREDPAG